MAFSLQELGQSIQTKFQKVEERLPFSLDLLKLPAVALLTIPGSKFLEKNPPSSEVILVTAGLACVGLLIGSLIRADRMQAQRLKDEFPQVH